MSTSRLPRPASRRLRIEPLEDRRLLAVFTVTNLDDSGAGSLRQAILDANAAAGADEIDFNAAVVGTINLTSGELTITDDLTINGLGPDRLTIDANEQSRVFNIDDGTASRLNVEIGGMTISGGRTTGGGGGIFSRENLSVMGSTISGNMASSGGGIASVYSDLTVTDSTISGNTAGRDGGGIYSDYSDLTVTGSTISDNSAGSRGGGIKSRDRSFNCDSDVTVTGSTISNNSAGKNGGGIRADCDVTVSGSTISDNSAGKHGGGIFTFGNLTVTRTTISGNTAVFEGGGISASYATAVTITNSTISGNTAGFGGGIYARNRRLDNSNLAVAVTGSTISDNSASFAGGIGVSRYLSNGDVVVTLTGSVLSGNESTVPGDIVLAVDIDFAVDVIFDVNYSVIGLAASTHVDSGSNNIVNDNPQLGPLADNGGPTQTHALLPGSPAIDAGDPDAVAGENDVPLFDQRGTPFDRVVNGRIDIGAYEYTRQPADLTGDGFVDFDDLTILLAHWDQMVSAGQGNLVDPLNTKVNFQDLTLLLAAWTGPGPAASPQPAATEAIIQRHPPTTQNQTATTARFDQLGRRAHTPSRRIDPSTKLSSHESPLRRLQAVVVDRAMGEEFVRDRGLLTKRRERRTVRE